MCLNWSQIAAEDICMSPSRGGRPNADRWKSHSYLTRCIIDEAAPARSCEHSPNTQEVMSHVLSEAQQQNMRTEALRVAPPPPSLDRRTQNPPILVWGVSFLARLSRPVAPQYQPTAGLKGVEASERSSCSDPDANMRGHETIHVHIVVLYSHESPQASGVLYFPTDCK